MAEIKGVLINAWLELLKSRFGESSIERAVAKLDVGDRAALANVFLPSSWYPYDTLQVLSRLTKQVAPASGRELAVAIGKAMAQHACTGVYKALIVADPLKQIERISWVGDLLFRNVRRCETQRTGAASGLVRYHYEMEVTPTAGMCHSVSGFLVRMIELAGGSNVTATHPKCVVNGADSCDFVLQWT